MDLVSIIEAHGDGGYMIRLVILWLVFKQVQSTSNFITSMIKQTT